jgi:hypothetical protein
LSAINRPAPGLVVYGPLTTGVPHSASCRAKSWDISWSNCKPLCCVQSLVTHRCDKLDHNNKTQFKCPYFVLPLLLDLCPFLINQSSALGTDALCVELVSRPLSSRRQSLDQRCWPRPCTCFHLKCAGPGSLVHMLCYG